MTAITYFTSAMILGTGNLTKSFTGAFFLQYGRDILEKVFIIENTVRKGKSWCMAVICRKRSAFDMQFHLVVVLIFLKTCVKGRGDSSAWLLESKDGFD